jgi:MarR family
MPEGALQVLADAGVVVVARGAARGSRGGVQVVVRLAVPGHNDDAHRELELEVRGSPRPLSATALAELARSRARGAARLLVVTPTASPAARERAAQLGISLIALNHGRASGADGHLVTGHGVAMSLPAERETARARLASGGRPWRTFLVVRAILLGGFLTQREMARAAGVSQPRVSQVLKDLTERQLVERGPSGVNPDAPAALLWQVVDPIGLISHWLDRYPGPDGVTTFWYGLGTPSAQAGAAQALLDAEGDARGAADQRCLVSGDVAADLLAPWARPRRAVVYARQGADLSQLGLTPSPAEHATLALSVPEDPGVWAYPTSASRSAGAHDVGNRLADPLQVAWDLRQSPGPDAEQAAERLIDWIVDRVRSTSGPAVVDRRSRR